MEIVGVFEMLNTYSLDETKNYIKYRTIIALPKEVLLEYDRCQETCNPIQGENLYTILRISKTEAAYGAEKLLDVVINGQKKRLSVKIPLGIKDGTYIRFKERGQVGSHGGKNGDIYVKVLVEYEMAMEKPLQETSLSLNFMDAVHGIEKQVSVLAKVKCESCGGTGMQANTICQQCKGQGCIVSNKVYKVQIPAGIDEGQILRINNENLIEPVKVCIHILPNAKFQRNGVNVHSNKYISKDMAQKGGTIPIETVQGIHLLQMEGPIKQGKRICIKNKGIPYLKNPKALGDHYVTFLIW